MVPQSPLAFIYHITEVSAFRDEMHHDMRQAFRRFGIDLGMVARLRTASGEPLVGPAADVALAGLHRASFEVERASYALRADPNEVLQVPMPAAALNLFTAIVPLLAWELENGTPGPDQVAPAGEPTSTLLHAVYLLFYSSAYRAQAAVPPPPVNGITHDRDAFCSAWGAVRMALDLPAGHRVSAAAITPAIHTLMVALADEFAGHAWTICW